MTPPPESSELDPLLAEAIEWVVKLKIDEPTRDEFEDYKRWRSRSPAHDAAFRRAAQIHDNAATASLRLASASQAGLGHRVGRRAFLGGGLAAAAAAGYAIVQPPFALWPSLSELSADYRTAKGEQRNIAVTPEVSLDLNTQTSIALKSRQGQPTIELVSGEVVVRARRPPQGALVLLAAGGQISATEAHFNTKCLDDAVSVTCLGGRVDVQHGGQTIQMKEGEQVSYTLAGLGTRVSVDPAQIVAWQSGLLVFRERPLASVVEEVNRYRAGKIIIARPGLRQRPVSGDFEIAKLETFVVQVQELTGAHVTSLPGGLTILS